MTIERMLELSILERFITQIVDSEINTENEIWFGNIQVNYQKLIDRCVELKSEFLKPYVIDTTSKED